MTELPHLTRNNESWVMRSWVFFWFLFCLGLIALGACIELPVHYRVLSKRRAKPFLRETWPIYIHLLSYYTSEKGNRTCRWCSSIQLFLWPVWLKRWRHFLLLLKTGDWEIPNCDEERMGGGAAQRRNYIVNWDFETERTSSTDLALAGHSQSQCPCIAGKTRNSSGRQCIAIWGILHHDSVVSFLFLPGPSTIDFGEVCVHSTSTRKMHILNNLPVHVWIQVEIESEELQQTSPLCHVMPPFTKTSIPVVFENNKLGNFRK